MYTDSPLAAGHGVKRARSADGLPARSGDSGETAAGGGVQYSAGRSRAVPRTNKRFLSEVMSQNLARLNFSVAAAAAAAAATPRSARPGSDSGPLEELSPEEAAALDHTTPRAEPLSRSDSGMGMRPLDYGGAEELPLPAEAETTSLPAEAWGASFPPSLAATPVLRRPSGQYSLPAFTPLALPPLGGGCADAASMPPSPSDCDGGGDLRRLAMHRALQRRASGAPGDASDAPRAGAEQRALSMVTFEEDGDDTDERAPWDVWLERHLAEEKRERRGE